MPQIVAAMFKDPAAAQQALQSLLEMGIAEDRIRTLGLDEARKISAISGFKVLEIPDESHAVLQSLPLPEEDKSLFEQGLRQGCALIAARIDRDNLDRAIQVLEMFDPVDLDSESENWMKNAAAAPPLDAGITGAGPAQTSNVSTLPGMGSLAEGADDLGTDDLKAGGAARQQGEGPSSTTTTGGRRSDERAEREGVNALKEPSGPARQGGLLPRQMNRGNRVRVFGTD